MAAAADAASVSSESGSGAQDAPLWEWCTRTDVDRSGVPDDAWYAYQENDAIESAYRDKRTYQEVHVGLRTYIIVFEGRSEVLRRNGYPWVDTKSGSLQVDFKLKKIRYVRRRMVLPTVRDACLKAAESADDAHSSGVCILCQDEFGATPRIPACKPWNCIHSYHAACVRSWVDERACQDEPDNCPMCGQTPADDTGSEVFRWKETSESFTNRCNPIERGHMSKSEAMEKSLWSLASTRERPHDTQKIRELLKHGVNIDCRNASGMTPLMFAASRGLLALCEFFVQEAGAHLDLQCDKEGDTALIAAARAGHVAVVRLLLKAGADSQATNLDGNTALDVAGQHGRGEVIDALVELRGRPADMDVLLID
eukprot:TRINITY_DN100606_c0_g1_i1.p1 TRINITY_DN100606_c0_g1~~TRINITY_DN100606_c0_g1_i1.p1  ORF type:complete len:368 (+),score=35.20 TRINITY_DN100606_c0_g1_i1:99-1202(+)